MTIAVLPSADGEEVLGQPEANLLWDAQVSVVHEGNRKCSLVQDMSLFKGTKALRPQVLIARESASKGQDGSSRGGHVGNGSCGKQSGHYYSADTILGMLVHLQVWYFSCHSLNSDTRDGERLGKDMKTFKQRWNLFSRIFYSCCCLTSKHGNLHQNLKEGIFWMNFAAREKKIMTQHTEGVISLDREMSGTTWIEVMLQCSQLIPRAIQV